MGVPGLVCQVCLKRDAAWWHAWRWTTGREFSTANFCTPCMWEARRTDEERSEDTRAVERGYRWTYLRTCDPTDPETAITFECAYDAIARLLRLLHDDAWRAEAWRVYRAREGRAAWAEAWRVYRARKGRAA